MFGRKAAKRAREQQARYEQTRYLLAKAECDAAVAQFQIELTPEGWVVHKLHPPFPGFLSSGFTPAYFSFFAGPFPSKPKAEAWLREHTKGPRPYDKNGKALSK